MMGKDLYDAPNKEWILGQTDNSNPTKELGFKMTAEILTWLPLIHLIPLLYFKTLMRSRLSMHIKTILASFSGVAILLDSISSTEILNSMS